MEYIRLDLILTAIFTQKQIYALSNKMYNRLVGFLVVTVHCILAASQQDTMTKLDACTSYMSSMNDQFIPISKAASDDISLFMSGKDKAGENMYFCKVNYDGKQFLGRGNGNSTCYVADGKHEAKFISGFKVLMQPLKVKLMWKNVTKLERISDWGEAEKLLESVNAVNLGENYLGTGFAGMCEEDPDMVQDVPNWRRRRPIPYPPYHPILARDKRWIISEENERKKRIPGFLQTNSNSTALKITWGGDALFCNTFTVLTCQERPQ